MHVFHAKNHPYPLRWTQYIIDFPTKYALKSTNIEIFTRTRFTLNYGTHAHLMVLSCHITSAWLMRMRQAKNHYDPLLRTQFTLNFPMKCDVNTNILKFSSESRKSYGTNTHLISCHIRLHVHDLCACVIPKSTTTRFVEHNLSSIFRQNMFK